MRRGRLTVMAIFPEVCRVRFPNKLAMRPVCTEIVSRPYAVSANKSISNSVAKKIQGLGYTAASRLDCIKVGAVAFRRH
jgi:hypothetical protein